MFDDGFPWPYPVVNPVPLRDPQAADCWLRPGWGLDLRGIMRGSGAEYVPAEPFPPPLFLFGDFPVQSGLVAAYDRSAEVRALYDDLRGSYGRDLSQWGNLRDPNRFQLFLCQLGRESGWIGRMEVTLSDRLAGDAAWEPTPPEASSPDEPPVWGDDCVHPPARGIWSKFSVSRVLRHGENWVGELVDVCLDGRTGLLLLLTKDPNRLLLWDFQERGVAPSRDALVSHDLPSEPLRVLPGPLGRVQSVGGARFTRLGVFVALRDFDDGGDAAPGGYRVIEDTVTVGENQFGTIQTETVYRTDNGFGELATVFGGRSGPAWRETQLMAAVERTPAGPHRLALLNFHDPATGSHYDDPREVQVLASLELDTTEQHARNLVTTSRLIDREVRFAAAAYGLRHDPGTDTVALRFHSLTNGNLDLPADRILADDGTRYEAPAPGFLRQAGPVSVSSDGVEERAQVAIPVDGLMYVNPTTRWGRRRGNMITAVFDHYSLDCFGGLFPPARAWGRPADVPPYPMPFRVGEKVDDYLRPGQVLFIPGSDRFFQLYCSGPGSMHPAWDKRVGGVHLAIGRFQEPPEE